MDKLANRCKAVTKLFKDFSKQANRDMDHNRNINYEACRDDLEAKFESVKQLCSELIDTSDDPSQVSSYTKVLGKLQSEYYNLKHRLIRQHQAEPVPGPSGVRNPVGQPELLECRLPAIEIPKFDGVSLSWNEFWEIFDASVHSKPLTDINKYVILKSKVEGEPALVIKGLSLEAANYPVALGLLKARFDLRHLDAAEHVKALSNLKPVSARDPMALREFTNNAQIHVRRLQALGWPDETFSFLIQTLLEKLPPVLVSLWYEEKQESACLTAPIKDFFTFLNKKIAGREFAGRYSNLKMGKESEDAFNITHKKEKNLPTVSALSVNTDSTMIDANEERCVYCNEGHKPRDCPLSVTDKFLMLTNQRRCYVCLKPGHRAIQCRHPYPNCLNCNKRHHTSICKEPKQLTPKSESPTSSN